MKAAWSAVAVAVLVVAVAMPVRAEEKKADRPGGAMVEAVSMTATIEKIDPKTREITLKGPKGGLTTFIAGDEVKRFNELKKGDVVTFDYTEGVAIDVQKSTEAPKMVETQSLTRSKPTERPGGSIETIGFLTARVDEIDYKTRVVKLALPEGQSLKFTVGDQAKRFNEVKKGDQVVVQYMQKLTIKVASPK
jgi:Cu/Ag efflux protein CusF